MEESIEQKPKIELVEQEQQIEFVDLLDCVAAGLIDPDDIEFFL